ncbi:efflux RND transporter periplasmic adaptor subunit [Rufibacter hautae]|uniref:HlyD family efflux transporter periplasmic adaptor subunit n=1 Tax=Rufibacter hautae TaxID=2595005 RepID=A0A5B6TLL8_9BACT|nr:efflux RND transporter periplasmic adaptor subunit [Rufibacter hautae]KAA3440277.1 HlyD family efflux transporter periplasmic adaptor subunit [Rufibacter hautae]
MRKNWKNKVLGLLLLLLPFTFSACQDKHGTETGIAHAMEYTCPMHPQIVQDKPGSCPICGMDLVAKQPTNTPAVAVSTDLNYLLQPANQTVVSSIQTTQPVQKQVEKEITMSGVVTYDTRRQYMIPARFGGRIEKLYVKFNYQPVRNGQRLYDIYSPELVTAQKELLYLLQNDPGNTALISGARQKLRLLGVTEGQIKQLTRTGRESYTFPVFSPYNGYVLDPAVTAAPTVAPSAAASAGGGDGMGGMSGSAASAGGATGSGSAASVPGQGGGFAIREGMYVTTGQALLKVVDASQVWAQFNVASNLVGQLRKGAPVTITFNQLPGKTLQSSVNLVEPVFEANENFARVRVSLPAQGNSALIGQVITGRTSYSTGSALWVPKEAVLDLGTQSVAFLKVDGVFKPVSVQVGQRADGKVEVVQGLTAQDVIAANAQFLVDSESFIRVKETNR